MSRRKYLFGMKRKPAGFFLFCALILAGPAIAQVHIEEKAVITPRQPAKVQADGTNNHIIRFEFYWDNSPKGRVDLPTLCPPTETRVETSSSIIITITSPHAEWYDFYAYVLIQYCTENLVSHYSWSLYYDDSLVASASDSARLKGDCYIPGEQWVHCATATFFPPYYPTFEFSLGTGQFRAGDTTGISLKGADEGGCSSTAWSPHTDPVTLTIVSDSQYVSFHKTDPQTGIDTRLGSTVTTIADDIGKYSLVADGAAPDSDGDWATIEAVSSGITRADSVQVLPAFGHFSVHPIPDTIEDSGMTILYVQAKDGYDQDMVYDGDIQISALPGEYGELGWFTLSTAVRNKNGAERKQAASSVAGEIDKADSKAAYAGTKSSAAAVSPFEVSYSLANAGMVFYTADGVVPDTNTTITFAVTGVDKPSDTGTGSVVIRGNQPKLAILEPTANTATQYITDAAGTGDPVMPTVTCEAQLQNYNGGDVTYKWMFSTADTFLQETSQKPRRQLPPRYSGIGFYGQTSTTGSAVSQWAVPFNTLFTGGKTLLIVTAKTNDGKKYADTLYANLILGKNPSLEDIKKLGVSPAGETIMTLENSNWHQFNESETLPYNRDGYPIYGPPHGFGLMQLDNGPSPSEQDLWNWQTNLNDGLSKFHSMLKSAAGYATRVEEGTARYQDSDSNWVVNDPVSIHWYGHWVGKDYVETPYSNAGSLTGDQVLREAFQRYNGGAYWRWYPDQEYKSWSSGKWEPDPPKGTGSDPTSYGDKAWNVYEKILGGWTPAN